MTSGKPFFETDKIKNKVSEVEFLEMRREMIKAGGKWLLTARVTYILMLIHAVLSFLAWTTNLVLVLILDKRIESLEVSTIVKIAVLIAPNIVFQIGLKFFMYKTCREIKKILDYKNEEVYKERGINWLTCGTLVYIQIKIVDTELQCFDEYLNTSGGFGMEKSSAFETIKKNPNREILLKNARYE